MAKSVPAASLGLKSFACPHCGAHATQFWAHTHINFFSRDSTPTRFDPKVVSTLKEQIEHAETEEEKANAKRLHRVAARISNGRPFIERQNKHVEGYIFNLLLSECQTCHDCALWLNGSIIYPLDHNDIRQPDDLPAALIADFDEARNILALSPRGAAALLRLCVEKLCGELGASGKTIDEKIASLVQSGLDPMVQKALDAIRVIGNHAIHPGQIDIKDDRGTAEGLFVALDLIVDQMITRPKKINALYGMLPAGTVAAIEQRNQKAISARPTPDDV